MGALQSHINRQARRRAAAALAVVCGLLFCSGTAVGDLSQGLVQVATGHFEGHTWTLSMSRRRGLRCYQVTLVHEPVRAWNTVCEEDRQPPTPWEHITGSSGKSASVELEVTRPDVRRLKLLLAHPGGNTPPTWESLPTRELTAGAAREAQLERNFRYAVATGPGPHICVRKVRAYSRSGRLLESLSVPCDF